MSGRRTKILWRTFCNLVPEDKRTRRAWRRFKRVYTETGRVPVRVR